jgi:AraC family transcriptional regulator
MELRDEAQCRSSAPRRGRYRHAGCLVRETFMNPVTKALWFIESHFAEEVTLAEVSEVAGVSRFHMARAFGMTTGHSVMRYVRGRRLTEAARALAKGAPDIIWVALDAGYGSHEAFTRAFRDQFGLTPETVRASGSVHDLALVEAFTMDKVSKNTLTPPRMEDRKALLVAGLGERYRFENVGGLPALWTRFSEHLGHVAGQVGNVAYGVCYNTDDTGFDYIAGVEVADFDPLPAEFSRVRVPAQRYAVFAHHDHVSTVRGTFMAIFNDWLPKSGYRSADAPVFARYDERFDPRTGTGGFEIWVPVTS